MPPREGLRNREELAVFGGFMPGAPLWEERQRLAECCFL